MGFEKLLLLNLLTRKYRILLILMLMWLFPQNYPQKMDQNIHKQGKNNNNTSDMAEQAKREGRNKLRLSTPTINRLKY